MEHNPNPFDFVPFSKDRPNLKTREEFDTMGEMYSGYLELKIKALTPVHIVGYQKESGKERNSYMYRQDGKACIPASTIRGCLRSFIETISNGWASQVNDKYEKVYGVNNPKGRHLTFKVFEDTGILKSAIKEAFKPNNLGPIDLASYLFGFVLGEGEKDASKSKISFEDAYILENHLDKNGNWIPDVSGDAFMGGPKPSASSWWYMQPHKIWARNVKVKDFQKDSVEIVESAEFIGEKYRGRKFYYHQLPKPCIEYYKPESKNWKYRDKNPFCKVEMECLRENSETEVFRIYINKMPQKILSLIIKSLLPGKHIRHKLGYGKAYGYGSIEFVLSAAKLRKDSHDARIPANLVEMKTDILNWTPSEWDKNTINQDFFNINLIDWAALEKIAQIMAWDNNSNLKFTYPPFSKGFFATGITKTDFENMDDSFSLKEPINVSTPPTSLKYSVKVKETKKTVDFDLYQQNSNAWSVIKNRKP